MFSFGRSTVVVPVANVRTTDTVINATLDAAVAIMKRVPSITSIERRNILLSLVQNADEVFSMTVGSTVSSIHTLNGLSVGCKTDAKPGPFTAEIHTAFQAVMTDSTLWKTMPPWNT
jgi:hypothetical protein